LLISWAVELAIQVPALLLALPLARWVLRGVRYGRPATILPRCLGVAAVVSALVVLLRGVAPILAYGQGGILVVFAMGWLSIRIFFPLDSFASMALAAFHALLAAGAHVLADALFSAL
jgi:hypothetical protein